MKILIAEDDSMIMKLIRTRLEKDGYEVITANNGDLALDKIKEEYFDLIITDIMMPFISGLELVSTVKNTLKKKTPIIVLSNMHLEATILEAFRLGADDFITKPFSPNELSVRVAKILNRIELDPHG